MSAPEPRAGKPPTKKITVRIITWTFATRENTVTLRPDDAYSRERDSAGRTVGEVCKNSRTGETLEVPSGWLWREEQTREVDVPIE